jgi:hypothetical protein
MENEQEFQLEGLEIFKEDGYSLCIIKNLSEELKEIIRGELTSVCHGISNANGNQKVYNYKRTLREFLKRYDSKSRNIQVGMIGELLTHILIIKIHYNFDTISPFFNLEERSIKKGFDILLYSIEDNAIWITEVKSGELNKGLCSSDTNNVLLTRAKNDLKDKFQNSDPHSIWQNAINGVKIVLDSFPDKKAAIVKILEELDDPNASPISSNKKVVVVSSLFSNLKDIICKEKIKEFKEKMDSEDIFEESLLFCIQKETYEKVITFLREESKNE